MSRNLDDLAGNPKDQIMELAMSLLCGDCEEPVDLANYNVTKGFLDWVCSKGHKNHMKDFWLNV